MALSDAERAANYRYAARVEKTAEKLLTLLENPPEKYAGNYNSLPNRMQVDDLLFRYVSALLWGAPWQFVGHGEDIALQFVISMEGLPKVSEDSILGINKEKIADMDEFAKFRPATAPPERRSKMNMTRNAFCEQILGGKLTNPPWAWVGVKEGENGEQGALYLFGWERNKGRDGPGTVGFFHREVGVDKVSGRRRPAHRQRWGRG